jgi:hypothetical protein
MWAVIAEEVPAPPVTSWPEATYCFRSKNTVELAGTVTADKMLYAVPPLPSEMVAVAAEDVMFVRAMFVTIVLDDAV